MDHKAPKIGEDSNEFEAIENKNLLNEKKPEDTPLRYIDESPPPATQVHLLLVRVQ